MERFVLETSVLTNPDVYEQFSSDPYEAIRVFLGLARRSNATFYMPRSVYQELLTLRELDTPLAADFQGVIHIRSPRKYNLMLPGNLLFELIEEVRMRIDRGLRIAEEHARMSRDLTETHDVGTVINKLRDRYREALRRGILDSCEDVDVLLLAYELDATMLSADEGLRKWTDKMGVRLIYPQYLRSVMENPANQHRSQTGPNCDSASDPQAP